MSPTSALDDDVVARLLAEDARKASSRYASQGLSALLPKRVNGGAPKPNTRFLKNLVRDADSHNAALRRKEEQERRQRLRQLDRQSEQGGPHQRERGDDRERKRRRLDREDDKYEPRRQGSPTDKGRTHRHRHRREQMNTNSERSVSRSRSRDSSRPDRKHRSHRDREPSTERQNDTRAHRKHHRRRSESPDRPNAARTRPTIARERLSASTSHKRRSLSRSSSSDPLEDLVGPLPASKNREFNVRPRGRGAYNHSGSAMDDHFSANYDPTLDVHPDSEDSAEKEDWDMALEALRDRQQWKKKHAERMREAGFDDDEIKKWEDSGKEKSAGDLKWRKAGEGREWDAGKEVTDVDESYGRLSRKTDSDLEASWKRKSGSLLKDIKSSKR